MINLRTVSFDPDVSTKLIHGHASGGTVSRTYRSWQHMHQRCSNPNNDGYSGYGERGIKVCDRWNSFVNFLEDMGERPDGTTLDRTKGDLGYTKENCQWATPKQQASNRRPKPIQKNNSTGIMGVSFDKSDGRWQAYCYPGNGKQIRLYRGGDFFNACCARKSWDAKNQNKDAS